MLNLTRTVSCSIFNFTGVTWSVWSRGSQVHTQAKTGEKSQLTDCMVVMNCTVVAKTFLIGLSLGTGSRVEEMVKLSNCTVSCKSSVKLSILGREQKTAEGTGVISQLVLAGSTSRG